MSVERGWVEGALEKIDIFLSNFSKKVVFLVSSEINKIHHFLPPLEKSFASLQKTTIARPG